MLCTICQVESAKYTCPKCRIRYCSVDCFTSHKGMCQSSCVQDVPKPEVLPPPDQVSKSLRPLTSLKWPYVEEPASYPDPLDRNDPKPLQLHQYEAIATSPLIRDILAENSNLRVLLTTLDKLRGLDRERALRQALDVSSIDQSIISPSHDTLALRALAAAIEGAIREQPGALGLDWEEENQV